MLECEESLIIPIINQGVFKRSVDIDLILPGGFVMYSRHPLSGTPTGSAKTFAIVNDPDSWKFKIIAFYKVSGKPNTIFTSMLTSVSLKGSRRENILIFFQ